MADPNQRDAKLIQYLSEAYGKERELEVALQADIAMTTKAPYKKRLQQHLKETKAHAKALDRRIKKLGGGGQTVQSLVGKATAVAKGPLHAVRGDGQQEKMLKNAKTQYTAEQEEISTYLALEVFATKVGDSETAKLARDIRREEERMAKFLEGQIRQLAAATALDEVPAAQRRSASKETRSAKKAAAKPRKRRKNAKPAKSKKAAAKKRDRQKISDETKRCEKAGAEKIVRPQTAKKPQPKRNSKRGSPHRGPWRPCDPARGSQYADFSSLLEGGTPESPSGQTPRLAQSRPAISTGWSSSAGSKPRIRP